MGAPAKHRASLVRSAMRLFRRQGYASTGLQEILALSGAPRGSLYHYFPGGKEAIGAEAVELAGREVARMLEGHAVRHRSAPAFLRACCRTYADWMAASEFRAGCPIATTLLETAPASEAITRAGLAAVESWVAIVAGVLERAGSPRRAARERAELFVSALEGALVLARVTRSTGPILNVARSLNRAG